MPVTDNAAVDSSHNKLPLPTLCFAALGVPTFYMPLAYLALMLWAALVMIPLAAFMLYSAIVFLPSISLRIFSDPPTRTIIVDSVAQTREEISLDPKTQKLHTQLVMIFGAMAGAMATASLLLLAVAIPQVCGPREQRTLIEFVKATGSQHTDHGMGIETPPS